MSAEDTGRVPITGLILPVRFRDWYALRSLEMVTMELAKLCGSHAFQCLELPVEEGHRGVADLFRNLGNH